MRSSREVRKSVQPDLLRISLYCRAACKGREIKTLAATADFEFEKSKDCSARRQVTKIGKAPNPLYRAAGGFSLADVLQTFCQSVLGPVHKSEQNKMQSHSGPVST